MTTTVCPTPSTRRRCTVRVAGLCACSKRVRYQVSFSLPLLLLLLLTPRADLIRGITDPEHPLTLEQLSVVYPEGISVDDAASKAVVEFTPTVPHCSMATLIGLCVRVRLLRSLPNRFKASKR
jgi:hypothetical protein